MASLIHESTALGFNLNVGTVSEPKKATVSMAKLKEDVTAQQLAAVATAADATFANDVSGHSLTKKYSLDIA